MKEDCISISSHTKVQDVIKDFINYQEEYPFFICDINDLIYKVELWKKLFPRVEPHYAVKCNNYKTVIQVLAALGLGFDCASRFEIDEVLSVGVDPSKIIFAHTCKPVNHIKYAATKNVSLMTLDCKEEIYKIKTHFLRAQIVLRIKYDDPNASCIFGDKFGCDPYIEAEEILKVALEQNVKVVGVSFHIGSGSKTAETFYGAIKAARYVFDIAIKLGHNLNLLDIGGGFPGRHDDLILSYAKSINDALNEYFPDQSVRIISEPGTYFVESTFTLACCVQSVKEKNQIDAPTHYNYYINDGVFGNLSGIISYHIEYVPRPVKIMEDELYISTVWGPTCDIIDKVCDNILLPKMSVGDWLIIDNIGNYSSVVATSFNGFGSTITYSIINPKNKLLLENTGIFKSNYFIDLKTNECHPKIT